MRSYSLDSDDLSAVLAIDSAIGSVRDAQGAVARALAADGLPPSESERLCAVHDKLAHSGAQLEEAARCVHMRARARAKRGEGGLACDGPHRRRRRGPHPA